MTRAIQCVGVVLVLAVASAALADHDITIPYEAPEGTAVINGVLDDWADATWILLDEDYNAGATDVTSAKYALRWNDAENLLYFAVEVVDTHHVLDLLINRTSWDTLDDIEVSIDGGNQHLAFGALMTLGQQLIFGADGLGGDWVVGSWNLTAGPDLVPDYAVVVNGDVVSYEGTVVPYSYYGAYLDPIEPNVEVDLAVDTELGFDVIACSRSDDVDPFGMKSNNLIGGKFNKGASLQSWVLVAGDSLQADFDNDGDVDLDDFVILKTNFGTGDTHDEGDADGDADVDLDDFVILKNEFGS